MSHLGGNFNDLKTEGFSEEVALYTTIMIAINETVHPTDEEMCTHGLYTKRLEEMFYDNLLWELSEEDKELCSKLWKAHHSYNIQKALQPLGGCKKKSYKELIEEV